MQQKDHFQHLFDIPDPESCHKKCSQHDSCEFFVWVSSDYSIASYHFNCFLKWGSLSLPVDADTAFFSNYKDCRLPCKTFHSVDFDSDENQIFYNIPDAESCAQKCLEHVQCEFFIWISTSFHTTAQHYQCWLKWSNLRSVVEKNGVFSNFKNCSATIDHCSGCCTELGKSCVIPFHYGGINWTTCSSLDTDDPWCATEVDEDGQYIGDNWGICNQHQNCPMP